MLQAAIGSCIDFKGERNEVIYEALQFPSLTYVWREWERYGAVIRVVESDDGRTIPTERIVEAIGERTALVVDFPRVLRFWRAGRYRRHLAAMPRNRRAAMRGCVPDDGHRAVRRVANWNSTW